jgi:hypothetical protein
MIDFEAVIRYFGPQAVALQLEEAGRIDCKAVAAVNSRTGVDPSVETGKTGTDYVWLLSCLRQQGGARS